MTKNIAPWRFYFVLGLMIFIALILVARLVDLHVINNAFLRHQGDARMVRTVTMAAYRGMLTDRNGEPLAVSAPVASIWINPTLFLAADKPTQQKALTKLSKLLDIPRDQIKTKITAQSTREFLYLKRHVNPDVAVILMNNHFPGVHLQTEFHRYYPAGEVTAQLIGFTDVDDKGREGLELAFNKMLTGKQGAKRVVKDRVGNVIEELAILKQPQDGEDVILSIDRRLQYLAYRELKAAMIEHNAKAASAVIVDINTGEVLAMANVPSFNPNNRDDRAPNNVRNRAVTDLFEPGSVFKTMSMAAALENKVVSPNATFDTTPGYMRVNHNVVRDIRNFGELTLPGILEHSSNVGITKVVKDLPADKLVDTLRHFGFGESTQSGFPGEREGVINVPRKNDYFGLATLSFGYGASVTVLQLANAYATLASDGSKKPITFIKTERPPKTERVISPKVATQIRTMLQQVVGAPGAGGWRAQVAGYTVAGKTGTVRKLGETGYIEDKHLALFAGFAPASKPRLALVILVDEPRHEAYYGGQVAAPLFSRIMTGALRLYDIPPDADITDTPMNSGIIQATNNATTR
jgi:cell division protein FtsI (penicillin-binding protein 3)